MPKLIEVTGVGRLSFPDEMDDDQISEAIDREFGGGKAEVRTAQSTVPEEMEKPPSDWLGVGEEIGGIGPALGRGVMNYLQAEDIDAMRLQEERKRALNIEPWESSGGIYQQEQDVRAQMRKIDEKGRSGQKLNIDDLRRRLELNNQLGQLANRRQAVGIMEKGQAAERFSQREAVKEQLPTTEAQKEFFKPETPWWKFFENPVELTALTMAESAPVLAQTMAAAPAGPIGVGLAAGGSSFQAESSARIQKSMADAGVDLKSPQ